MVSTPNAPDGLFESIEKEPEETCIYKRLFLDYTYGLDKIYTREEIQKAKQSPSFEREYNLKYLGRIIADIAPPIESDPNAVAVFQVSVEQQLTPAHTKNIDLYLRSIINGYRSNS